MRFSLFPTPKHRVFNYQPRYYNPEAEDLKNRIAEARGEKRDEKYVPGRSIRHSFRKALYEGRKRPKSRASERHLFLITLLILAFAAYYFARSFGLFFI